MRRIWTENSERPYSASDLPGHGALRKPRGMRQTGAFISNKNVDEKRSIGVRFPTKYRVQKEGEHEGRS